MTRTQNSLPDKLKSVLARLCKQLGPITKTKAVKLPYLVDVVANQVLGHRITEGTHETWDYGVVTREVFRAITHEDISPDFVVEAHDHSEGGQLVKLGSVNCNNLDEEELRVIDEVARELGHLDAGSLGQLTKALNSDLGTTTWGSNQRAAEDSNAFARLAAGWQSFARKLPDLDLSNRAHWGDPIDDPSDYVKGALNAS